jgi:hypothetical protein
MSHAFVHDVRWSCCVLGSLFEGNGEGVLDLESYLGSFTKETNGSEVMEPHPVKDFVR